MSALKRPDMSKTTSGDGAGDGTPARGPTAGGAVGRVGEILLALGRLSEPQIIAVLKRQSHDARQFGELALILGYASQSDIELALSHQRSATLNEVLVDFPRGMAGSGLDPDELGSEALVAVRSQLVHRWFGDEPEQRALAVVSTDPGDGRSYVCSRLARLFADLDEDTLLIDADLRNPSLHRIFGADNSVGLTSFLQGELAQPPVRSVPGVPYLHLLTAGPAVDNPHRLIAAMSLAACSSNWRRSFAPSLSIPRHRPAGPTPSPWRCGPAARCWSCARIRRALPTSASLRSA